MKRLICIFMALLMLCCVCLPSCKADGETQSSDTEQTQPSADIDLSEYKIIYPMTFTPDERASVTALANKLNSAYGIRLKSGSDFVQTSEQTAIVTEDKEILIGKTNRKQTADVAAVTKGGEYTVCVVDQKVVVYGATEQALERAIQSFTETVIANGSLCIAADYSKTVNLSDEMYPAGSAMHTLSTEYKIVYPQDNTKYEQKTAGKLKDMIEVECGRALAVSVGEGTGKTVLVGGDASALGYYDYKIAVSGTVVSVSGGSAVAIEWAVQKLVDTLKDGSFKLSDGYSLTVEFDEKHFNPIVNDLSNFTPSWSSSYTAPSWLSNFDEKTYAVTCPDGRITVKAHRGDCENYPENSIEAIASAILAGVDAIELDVHTTKDGIAVLMHDDTLTRTTDVDKYRGKSGFPSSSEVSAWTYEQLMTLTLKHKGNDTQMKIPTLYEALKLCAGRIFVQIDDKSGAFANTQNDIYYIAKATDSMECFFHHYGINALRKWVLNSPDNTELAAYVEKCESYLAESGHSIRKVYWPNESPNRGTYTGYPLKENPTEWDEMYDEGRRMFWSENVVPLMNYIVNTKGQTATK